MIGRSLQNALERHRTSLRQLRVRLLHLALALRLVWGASKGWSILWGVIVLVQGLLPAAVVYLTKALVDALAAVAGSGVSAETVQPLIVPALLMGGTLALYEALQALLEWIRTAQADLVKDHISSLIHQKAYSVDLAFFDSSENYDHLQQAKGSGARSLQLLENLSNLLRSGVSLAAIAALLIPYGAWLPLVLVVSLLPAFYAVLYYNRLLYQWWKRKTEDERVTYYYDWLLTSFSNAAAEVRLFMLGPHFAAAYQSLRRRLRGEQLSLIRRQGTARFATSLLALVVTGSILAWMTLRAMRGTATLGDVALFYQAFNQGQNMMRTLMRSVSQIYDSSFYLGHLFELLKVQRQVASPSNPVPVPTPLQEAIVFRNVTFRYPSAEKPALSNFDLTLPAGRTVAIVGPNGAGKSTLIKLLCRYYDPDAGSIEFDGIDIRRFSIEELQRQITVLFQSPVQYQDTAARNIEMGDLAATSDPARTEAAAREAGAHETIMRLPRRYATQLGHWFRHGTELSGGEWQRLSLARACYREAQIVILDEPTSFMDSWAEAEWLDRFTRFVRDRTAVFITHRFTTAMRADIIHVMQDGRVVDSGNHQALLAKGGLYAQSWKAQMQSFPSALEETTNGAHGDAVPPAKHAGQATHLAEGAAS